MPHTRPSGVVTEAPVHPRAIARFAEVLTGEQYARVVAAAERAREAFAGRTVWCVNSTASGGGVAEMLGPLLGYTLGAGVRARWAVLEGDPEFLAITKRIHHRLHGMPGDGGPLGPEEHAAYERTLARNAADLAEQVAPGDVVLLHDPQTAGLTDAMLAAGALVVWRVHVGVDAPNDHAREVWSFLTGYVERAHGYVFSREAYVWETLDRGRSHVIAPSIDAFSAKNQDLDPAAAAAILRTAGLTAGVPEGEPAFLRPDGTPAVVGRRAEIVEDAPVPEGAPLVVQVSRWDPLKDPIGVIEGFADRAGDLGGAHLTLAGPDVSAVTDDPEGATVFARVRERRAALDPGLRARVHLASLPMEDGDENAAMVNALQRRADVVVQKSLAEGFGLTVSEALWKSRAVLATRVGGIQDQVAHGVSGVLVDDAHDAGAFGEALAGLLADPGRRAALGDAGREVVRERFLESRHLEEWVDLLDGLSR